MEHGNYISNVNHQAVCNNVLLLVWIGACTSRAWLYVLLSIIHEVTVVQEMRNGKKYEGQSSSQNFKVASNTK